MQVKPEAIAIEDSLAGAQSAAAAGILSMSGRIRFRPEQFADFAKVVYSFDEIIRDVL